MSANAIIQKISSMKLFDIVTLTKALDAKFQGGEEVATTGEVSAIMQSLSAMSVEEVVNLSKSLEEKWGVSAAAVTVVAGAGGAAVEEKTEFDVVFEDAGSKKIDAIKLMREFRKDLDLGSAKAFVENPGQNVVSGVGKAEAEEIKKKFEAIGAKVAVK